MPYTMTPDEEAGIYGRGRGYAEQAYGSDELLQEALRRRARKMGDVTAEQFNLRGLSPQSGVFAGAMSEALANAAAEASLQRQQMVGGAAMQAGGDIFGQRFGGGVSQASTEAQIAAENERARKERRMWWTKLIPSFSVSAAV